MKNAKKKMAKILVTAYLIYSVLTDTLIWGGAIAWLILGGG